MSLKTKIEKGVPIPNGKQSGVGATLRKLSVGDSFVAPAGSVSQSNIHTVARWAGIKIATRTQGGKLRIWRIE